MIHSPNLPSACHAMLHILMRRHKVDFAQYQPASLLRRIELRMEQLGIAEHAAYADYLCSIPAECDQLFNMFLINHTAFFRDPDVWAALARESIPQLLAAKAPDAPLRIWSAGCATGQEPYSLAILLAEQLGLEALGARVTIYATDLDTEALEQAGQGRYHAWSLRMLPAELREKYFVWDGKHAVVREELRRVVVAARHDVLMDAPLPQIDLIACRNVLIYFTGSAQSYVVGQLREALADTGLLLVGKADLALLPQHRLRWVDRHHRIIGRMPDVSTTSTQHC